MRSASRKSPHGRKPQLAGRRQFLVPDRVKAFFADKRKVWAQEEADWNKLFSAYARRIREGQLWKDFLAKKLPPTSSHSSPSMARKKPSPPANAGGEILKVLFGAVPNLIGGSADLAPRPKRGFKEFGSFEKGNYGGRNLHFGIREHGMGTICAGIAYYGGLIPFGSTFFVFTDYMRPPIRLASLSGLQTIYVFTHDSICVRRGRPDSRTGRACLDHPRHPRCDRPAPGDANEPVTPGLPHSSIRRKPAVIMLTRQNLPVFDRTKTAPAAGVLKGGYTLWESKPGTTPEIILIGTGSETSLAFDAAQKLGAEGKSARAVSLPSWALFEKQSQEYKDSVLPPAVTKRVAVEAGIRLGWERYTTTGGKFVGVNKFGHRPLTNAFSRNTASPSKTSRHRQKPALEAIHERKHLWILQVAIHPGKLEDFRAVARDLIAKTESEPGTLAYEWKPERRRKVSATSTSGTRDSAAMIVHVQSFGALRNAS